MIRMEDGTLLTENDKIAKAFKNMFQTLLNQPRRDVVTEEYDTVEQNIERPTKEEVETGLDMLKNGKAPGANYIIPECLKNGGEQLIKQLHKLINKIWDKEEIPIAWSTSVLCLVFKKGDTMCCTNYRGISLLNTSYKMLSNVLLNRLKPYIKEIIGDYQAGFMAGKSTLDQIHVVKQIIEKSHEFDKDVHLLFVDFKAAYDSVNRERLWKVMDQLGIPRKIIRMIRACVNGSKCKVKYGGEESEEFEVKTGLRQGDALSPALFNIALESASGKWEMISNW